MYVHKYNCKYCGRELQLRCSRPLSWMIYSIFDRNGCCDECWEKLDYATKKEMSNLWMQKKI